MATLIERRVQPFDICYCCLLLNPWQKAVVDEKLLTLPATLLADFSHERYLKSSSTHMRDRLKAQSRKYKMRDSQPQHREDSQSLENHIGSFWQTFKQLCKINGRVIVHAS